MANETVNYKYETSSSVKNIDGKENLLLSKFSEIEKGNSPCFFWGKLHNPYELSRCLITLSNIVEIICRIAASIICTRF